MLLFAQSMIVQYATPFTVGAKPVTITLDAAKGKSKLLRAAKEHKVALKIDGVSAAQPPGFLAAVYLGGQRVGEVALYVFEPPQTIYLPVDDALAKALRRGTRIAVRFVPESGLEHEPLHVAAPIRISSVALIIDKT